MRQAGILAAAALYALDHNIDRLAEDHANARRLAAGIRQIPSLRLDPDLVDTNILFFQVDARPGTAAEFCEWLRGEGLLMLPVAPTRVRAVTHLDVTAADVDRALEILARAPRQSGGARV